MNDICIIDVCILSGMRIVSRFDPSKCSYISYLIMFHFKHFRRKKKGHKDSEALSTYRGRIS